MYSMIFFSGTEKFRIDSSASKGGSDRVSLAGGLVPQVEGCFPDVMLLPVVRKSDFHGSLNCECRQGVRKLGDFVDQARFHGIVEDRCVTDVQ